MINRFNHVFLSLKCQLKVNATTTFKWERPGCMLHSYSTMSRDIYPRSRLCECVFECACSVEWLCSHHSSMDRQFVSGMVTGSCSENGHRLDEFCGHATPSVKHTFTHTQNTHQCTHNKHKLNQYRKKQIFASFGLLC